MNVAKTYIVASCGDLTGTVDPIGGFHRKFPCKVLSKKCHNGDQVTIHKLETRRVLLRQIDKYAAEFVHLT